MNRLDNIVISDSLESFPFTPSGGGGGKARIPKRQNRQQHAYCLEKMLDEAATQDKLEETNIISVSDRNGIYLEFRGKSEYDLITKSLEHIGKNVRMCNVREVDETKFATVFIPNNQKDFFIKKIKEYREKDKNKEVIDSIEEIALAMVDALWTDKRPIPEESLEGCEVWLSVYKKENHMDILNEFFDLCDKLEIEYSKDYIIFPERAVVAIRANKKLLKDILWNSGHIAEFRKLSTPANFFIENNSREEQGEWVQELLNRVTFNEDANTSICILDKGVSNGHPLIAPVLKDDDMHTTFADGIVQDISQTGHGTGMAGIATYFDLENLLESNEHIKINHKLESVRIVDDKIKNQLELYGDITSQAINKAEITNPKNNRVVVMAVTAETDINADKRDKDKFRGDGNPTSWSAALDNLALGNYESEDSDPRLIIVSAGNTYIDEIEISGDYKTAVVNHSVENPAQSWNVLTVGAYTNKSSFDDGSTQDGGYSPLVEPGSYSPFNSSSLTWENKWPIKPDIVLEGGNLGYNENDAMKYCVVDKLSLLTTSNDFQKGDFFTTMAMTSPASAQAANMAAKIMERYPDAWPETIRALLVHSAEWTDAMIRQAYGDEKFDKYHKKDKRRKRDLLRIVGYGVPDLERALYSASNSVNLVIEGKLQPFIKEKGKSVVIKEMSLYELPWPKEVLLGLGETEVILKVTLSYFIDPAPGEKGWDDKYRYPGCRLNFDINNINESKEKFLERINKEVREEDFDKESLSKNDSDRWFFGSENRNVGSIHSDFWIDTGANLAEERYLAVYPEGGWWKLRPHLGKANSKIRYSMIVSISTPEQSVDLYTPIKNVINNKIDSKTVIENKIKY